jgi:membrane-bound lytic murein transglycosylase B
MMATGILLIVSSPLPLIASSHDPIQVEATKAWDTELVLADATPTFLADKGSIAIEKAPSRHDEALAAQRKKRTVSVTVKATTPKASVALPVTAATVGCSNTVSFEEKQAWAAKAAAANGIPTSLLMAVWQVESGQQFCSATRSSAGATGPMQFIPSTWHHYAVDGNGDGVASINDARDALFGAARLLAANGANKGDYRKAIFSYNHANWYVTKIIAMAGL